MKRLPYSKDEMIETIEKRIKREGMLSFVQFKEMINNQYGLIYFDEITIKRFMCIHFKDGLYMVEVKTSENKAGKKVFCIDWKKLMPVTKEQLYSIQEYKKRFEQINKTIDYVLENQRLRLVNKQ